MANSRGNAAEKVYTGKPFLSNNFLLIFIIDIDSEIKLTSIKACQLSRLSHPGNTVCNLQGCLG